MSRSNVSLSRLCLRSYVQLLSVLRAFLTPQRQCAPDETCEASKVMVIKVCVLVPKNIKKEGGTLGA